MADAALTFTLPWPPSVNTYWRTPRRGQLAGLTLLSERARKYRQAALAAIVEQKVPRGITKGRLAVDLEACPPDYRRRDLDNLFKGVLDALVHALVIEDDGDIDQLQIRRAPKTTGGAMRVTVSVLEEA
jgi:crossover junction endodeoxyribonuclease RusA